jgi:DNA-binding MurR/RpiR family transcriptional regulator
VIAVTGLQDNPLSRVADIRLHTVADEERARSSSITARDAQLTLTDLLFLLLVQRQPDANDYVHNSELAVSVLKSDRTRGRHFQARRTRKSTP